MKRAEYIVNELKEHGYRAYLVGGCVRDMVVGEEAHDYDITTSARPAQVVSLFATKCKVLTTGVLYGTVVLIIEGTEYEVTTFRKDISYNGNRHPKVDFTDKLEEDLQRRDFTINSLAYDFNGIIGSKEAIEDIESRTLRCVGEPTERFREDPLRILRAVRFKGKGFKIEDNTLNGMYLNLDELDRVSNERKSDELIKILKTKNAAKALIEHKEVIFKVINELEELDFEQNSKYHKYSAYEHTTKLIEYLVSIDCKDEVLLMSALLHDIGKPSCLSIDDNGYNHYYGHAEVGSNIAEEILKRMRFDKKFIRQVTELVHYHMIRQLGNKGIRRILNKIGSEQFDRLLVLMRADYYGLGISNEEILKDLDNMNEVYLKIANEEKNNTITAKSLEINGYDLMKLGFNGKEIGDILNNLIELVVAQELENSREALIEYVQSKKK